MVEDRPDEAKTPRPSRILLRPRRIGPGQRRATDRATTHRWVTARLDETDVAVEVPIVDVSPTGLRLIVGEPVEEGTVLVIDVLPGLTLNAVARWSHDENGDFLIGAEWQSTIEPELVWKIRGPR